MSELDILINEMLEHIKLYGFDIEIDPNVSFEEVNLDKESINYDL